MNNQADADLARLLAAQLAAYTAPWQVPQRPGYDFLPVNPVSEKRYKGTNAVDLAARAIEAGYADNRWLTAKQAESLGATMRPKQAGHAIRYWKFSEQGDQQTVRLDKPKVMLVVVYNAEQFDGMPGRVDLGMASMDERTRAVSTILRNSHAAFVADANNPHAPSRYDPERDVILVKMREQGDNLALQQMEAIHQLAHWTGHQTRFGFGGHPVGSTDFAREELRANLASMFVADELRVGFDPREHLHYAETWREIIDRDPAEIFRAATMAERIAADIVEFSIERREIELSQEQMQELALQAEYEREREGLLERHGHEYETVHNGSGRSEEMPSELSERHHRETAALETKFPGFEAARMERQGAIELARMADFEQRLRAGEFSRRSPTLVEKDHPSMRESSDRTYIAVPYAEREAAKALGARWDKEAKSWFVPENTDLTQFERWRPESGHVVVAQEQDPVSQFADALKARGLVVDGVPVMNGKMQRVPVIGDTAGERSGAYKGHLDGIPAGYVENFKDGQGKQNWKATGRVAQLTDEQRASLLAQAAQHKIEQQQAREAAYTLAATQVAQAWERAMQAGSHSYLDSKGVPATGLKVGTPGQTMPTRGQDGKETQISIEGRLIVPARDAEGKLTSLQIIDMQNGESRKQFWLGGKIAGSSHMIGDPAQAGPIIVAEGYATGATLHQATGQAVAVAFNAYNLQAVAEQVRAQYPDRTICVAGDNDHAKEKEIDGRTGKPKENVGRKYAERAASAVNGRTLLPTFGADQTKLSDWNDLAKAAGQETVKRQIAEVMTVADVRAKAIEATKERPEPRGWKFWKSPTREKKNERELTR